MVWPSAQPPLLVTPVLALSREPYGDTQTAVPLSGMEQLG
jgi:hypothetical protein